jgi:hypothetical protein
MATISLTPEQQATYDAAIAKYGYTDPTPTVNKLPTATAPTTASNINTVNSTNLPVLSPYTGSITNATGATTALQSFYDTQSKIATDSQAQLEKLQAQQQTDKSSILSFLSKQQSPDQVRSDLQAQFGIDPANYFADQKARVAEIDSLSQDYNKKVAERDKILMQAEENSTGMLSNALDARLNKIKQNYAIELNQMSSNINSKAATMQALEGNFNSAQDFIRQAVQDSVSDTKYKLDTLMTFYQMNQDSIDRLDNKYQDALKTSITLARDQYDQSLSTKNTIGQLILNYPKAGITMNDTIEQAYQKAGVMAQTTPTGGGTSGSGTTSGGYKFTSTQLNKGAATAGMDLSSFKSLDPDVQNYYISASKSALDAMLQAVQKGDTALIDSSSLAPAVKEYFKSRITTSTNTSSGGGFSWSNIWTSIKDIFN